MCELFYRFFLYFKMRLKHIVPTPGCQKKTPLVVCEIYFSRRKKNHFDHQRDTLRGRKKGSTSMPKTSYGRTLRTAAKYSGQTARQLQGGH